MSQRSCLAISGVAAVAREGGVDRQIRVILDPAELQAQGLTAAEVNQQLRASNINAAGGRAEIAGSEQSVRVLGNATDRLSALADGSRCPGAEWSASTTSPTSRIAYSEQRSLAKLDGRQVISFNVNRAKGASDVSVYDGVWDQLHKIEKADPRIRFAEIDNSVDYTKDQYKSAMEGLIEGAVLAVLVV